MLGPRNPANLTRRGDKWTTRVFVPKSVAHLVGGRREITKTLGTTDKPTARLAAEKFRNEQYAEFERLLLAEAKPIHKTNHLSTCESTDCSLVLIRAHPTFNGLSLIIKTHDEYNRESDSFR